MSDSDAVDLLADLPQATAREILGEMEEDRAETCGSFWCIPMKRGGMMTTALLSLSPEETVESALKRWKEEEPELDVLYYIYVVDPAACCPESSACVSSSSLPRSSGFPKFRRAG